MTARGCLLGGAVGDALGAAVEFLTLTDIRTAFGPEGVRGYAPAYGRLGTITDDTQMTLFTAEGLLRGQPRYRETGDLASLVAAIHHAYLRWLRTQGYRPERTVAVAADGWLYGWRPLHRRRAPGRTCVSALRRGTALGEPALADNDSKGCGAVMRAAPVGLFAPALGDDVAVFALGARSGALTHGHPSGFLSAGHLAVTVAALERGLGLAAALDAADATLAGHRDAGELQAALAAARRLAEAGPPSPEALETLGGGWVGEEALAIAVCCALTAEDFAAGVLRAVNHSGDSDSTGAIAGNLLGAMLGEAAIPAHWLERLELRQEIGQVADDLAAAAQGRLDPAVAAARYPVP